MTISRSVRDKTGSPENALTDEKILILENWMMKELYHIMINDFALIYKSFCIINYENFPSLSWPELSNLTNFLWEEEEAQEAAQQEDWKPMARSKQSSWTSYDWWATQIQTFKTNIGCHKILTLLIFSDQRFIYFRRVYNLRSLSIMSITKANS